MHETAPAAADVLGARPAARPSSRAEFRSELIRLIAVGLASRRRRVVSVDVDGDTPLFDSGLVDSLAILELIAFIEGATGRPIPARQVHMKHFGTIDRICAAFWTDEPLVASAHSQLMAEGSR